MNQVILRIMHSKLVCPALLVLMFMAGPSSGNPAKVTTKSEPAVQPEVAAALITMAQQQQQQLLQQRSQQQQKSNAAAASQALKKYEQLLTDASNNIKLKHAVSVSNHGEANGAKDHPTLSENVARLLQLPRKLLGLGGAEEKLAEVQQKQLQQAAAAVAAAAALKKARSKQQKKQKKKHQARKDSNHSPLLLAKVTGTTGAGHSSVGQHHAESFPSASTAHKKTSTATYSDDHDPYSSLDVASLGVNYASAPAGTGQSGSAVGQVAGADYGESASRNAYGSGAGGLKSDVGASGGGGATYSDSNGHGGYYNDLSSYGSIDAGGGGFFGGAGGVLGGLASNLVQDTGKLLKGLGFLLPIGLFLAALPPNVINVAVTGTAGAVAGRRKKRSTDGNLDEDNEMYDDNFENPWEMSDRSDTDIGSNDDDRVETETSAPGPDKPVGESPVAAVLDLAAASLALNSHQSPQTVTGINDYGYQNEQYGTDSWSPSLETWPVMDMIDEYGVTALLTDPECQKRVFCELVQLGRSPDGNSVQRSLWHTVNSVPKSLLGTYVDARQLNILKAGECETFYCAKRQPVIKHQTNEI